MSALTIHVNLGGPHVMLCCPGIKIQSSPFCHNFEVADLKSNYVKIRLWGLGKAGINPQGRQWNTELLCYQDTPALNPILEPVLPILPPSSGLSHFSPLLPLNLTLLLVPLTMASILFNLRSTKLSLFLKCSRLPGTFPFN